LLAENADYPEMLPAFAELKKELESRTQWAWKLDEEVKMLREQIASLENSKSWQITKFLRVFSGLLLPSRKGKGA